MEAILKQRSDASSCNMDAADYAELLGMATGKIVEKRLGHTRVFIDWTVLWDLIDDLKKEIARMVVRKLAS